MSEQTTNIINEEKLLYWRKPYYSDGFEANSFFGRYELDKYPSGDDYEEGDRTFILAQFITSTDEIDDIDFEIEFDSFIQAARYCEAENKRIMKEFLEENIEKGCELSDD